MATRMRIKFNYKAFNEVRNSPEVVEDLQRRANAIAQAAGEGHEVSVRTGGARARASVRTDSVEAMLAEARDKTLTSAIDAGRG